MPEIDGYFKKAAIRPKTRTVLGYIGAGLSEKGDIEMRFWSDEDSNWGVGNRTTQSNVIVKFLLEGNRGDLPVR